MTVPPSLSTIPQGLVSGIIAGEVVLFVGSGLSAMAGLPLWSQTRDRLVDEIVATGMRTEDEVTIYRKWEPRDAGSALLDDKMLPPVERSRFFLREFCAGAPTRAHDLVAELGIRQVVTTNWDTLVESALDGVLDEAPASMPWQRRCFASFTWRDDIHLAAAERGDLGAWVFHLHGVFYRHDTIIWKQRDYDEIENNKIIMEFLKGILQNKTICFLGFGLQDEDLELALRSARFERVASRRTHYAIVPETHSRIDFIRDELGIAPIRYPVDAASPQPHREGIETTLEALRDALLARKGLAP